jgi:hypothetical protein
MPTCKPICKRWINPLSRCGSASSHSTLFALKRFFLDFLLVSAILPMRLLLLYRLLFQKVASFSSRPFFVSRPLYRGVW